MTSQATVTISFDFEIGWGDITNPNWKIREGKGVYDRLRAVLPKMLDQMHACSVPATWATVGGMIDDPSRRRLEHLPLQARDLVDRVLSEAKPSSFDGRDLFDCLLKQKTGHHVASHSYAHIPLNFRGTNNAFFAADLAAFNETLADYQLRTDSYVFPENREGHYTALSDAGFTKARVAAETYFKNRWLYLSTVPFIAPPLSREAHFDGLESSSLRRVTGSMLFNDAANPRKIPFLNRRVNLGLAAAIRQKGNLHIWAHPFNFAESPALLDAFLALMKRLGREQDAGRLVIKTM